jgi:hypothetical protein
MQSMIRLSKKLRAVPILSLALAMGFTLPGHAANSGPEGAPGLHVARPRRGVLWPLATPNLWAIWLLLLI